jgi:hypothetical protein
LHPAEGAWRRKGGGWSRRGEDAPPAAAAGHRGVGREAETEPLCVKLDSPRIELRNVVVAVRQASSGVLAIVDGLATAALFGSPSVEEGGAARARIEGTVAAAGEATPERLALRRFVTAVDAAPTLLPVRPCPVVAALNLQPLLRVVPPQPLPRVVLLQAHAPTTTSLLHEVPP